MQSTQHYIDNERDFIANISQRQPKEVIEFKTAILPMVEQVEIDVDIEKVEIKERIRDLKYHDNKLFYFFY